MKVLITTTLCSSLLLVSPLYAGNYGDRMDLDHRLDPAWEYRNKSAHSKTIKRTNRYQSAASHRDTRSLDHRLDPAWEYRNAKHRKVMQKRNVHTEATTHKFARYRDTYQEPRWETRKSSYKKPKKQSRATLDIVDTAVNAGFFKTLVTAVKKAGLVQTLKGNGPFTVFAPTDEAFSKIPQDQLNALIADKDALTKILTYHVVPGKVLSKDVVKLNSAKTVQGQSIRIDSSSGVMIDNARVVKADIVTKNGVIHIIDSVMLPM